VPTAGRGAADAAVREPGAISARHLPGAGQRADLAGLRRPRPGSGRRRPGPVGSPVVPVGAGENARRFGERVVAVTGRGPRPLGYGQSGSGY
jgi:hypothetical protein